MFKRHIINHNTKYKMFKRHIMAHNMLKRHIMMKWKVCRSVDKLRRRKRYSQNFGEISSNKRGSTYFFGEKVEESDVGISRRRIGSGRLLESWRFFWKSGFLYSAIWCLEKNNLKTPRISWRAKPVNVNKRRRTWNFRAKMNIRRCHGYGTPGTERNKWESNRTERD